MTVKYASLIDNDNASIYNPDMLETMRLCFEGGESVTSVCVALDISKQTYYRWKKENPEFNEAAEKGECLSQKHWEQIGKSGITGGIDKFAGSSWQFVMKNRFSDDYQDTKKDQKDSAVELLLNMLVEKNK